jgi:hypothetical protein
VLAGARFGAGSLAVLLLAACASTPEAPPAQTPAETPGIPADTAAAPATAEAAVAVPAGQNPFQTCLMPDENTYFMVDETRRRLHETVCGAALWFDGLFGEGNLAAARSTHGRIELINAYSEFEGNDTRVRFRAQARLPALERRVSAFIGRDNDEDFVRDRSEGQGLRSQASEIEQIDDWFAGLGYRIEDVWGVKTDFQVGVHGLSSPTVFARLRGSRAFVLGEKDAIYQRLTPFVNNRDGVGITSSTDVDHTLTPSRLLRWGTAGTVTQKSPGLEWRTALLLFQSLSARRAIAYEIFERGATAAPEPLAEYGVRTIYRQPLFHARMYANFLLGYSWPRTDPTLPREGSVGTSIGLELPFGDRPADARARAP